MGVLGGERWWVGRCLDHLAVLALASEEGLEFHRFSIFDVVGGGYGVLLWYGGLVLSTRSQRGGWSWCGVVFFRLGG